MVGCEKSQCGFEWLSKYRVKHLTLLRAMSQSVSETIVKRNDPVTLLVSILLGAVLNGVDVTFVLASFWHLHGRWKLT